MSEESLILSTAEISVQNTHSAVVLVPITSHDLHSHLFKKNYQFNFISFNKYLIDLLMRKRSNNLIKLIQMTK